MACSAAAGAARPLLTEVNSFDNLPFKRLVKTIMHKTALMHLVWFSFCET